MPAVRCTLPLRLILRVTSSLCNAGGGRARAAALAAGLPANRAAQGVSVLDKGLRCAGGSTNGQTGETLKNTKVTLKSFRENLLTSDPTFAAEPSRFSGMVGGGNLVCGCQIQEQPVPEGVTKLNIHRRMGSQLIKAAAEDEQDSPSCRVMKTRRYVDPRQTAAAYF